LFRINLNGSEKFALRRIQIPLENDILIRTGRKTGKNEIGLPC
jgi:hypothetical protein